MQIVISKQDICILSCCTWPRRIYLVPTERTIQVRVWVCCGHLAHRSVLAFRKARIFVFVLVVLPCATLPLEQPTLDATVSWQWWGRLGSNNEER
jgi:hypothetical protein